MSDPINLLPDCAVLEPLLADYAEGTLPPAEAGQVAAHLPGCPACQAQVAQYRQLFHLLDEAPPLLPPLSLRDDFLTMLAAEKAALPTTAAAPPTPPEAKVVPLRPAVSMATWLRMAASIALVAVGTVLGLLLRQGAPAVATQPAAHTLATELAVAASQPATASNRIQLVSEASATTQPGDPTVPVLISTLNGDANPNVRLAAADALFRLREDARVGPALVQSLPLQTDPNVQITLIELLVRLHEKSAVPQLQRLSQRADALPVVRQQAKQGVGILL